MLIKNFGSLCVSVLAASFSLTALAKTAEAPATVATPKTLVSDAFKVAIVDMQSAILQTDEGIKARAAIQKEAESKRDGLMGQQKELESMEKEIIAQQGVLPEEAKQKKHEEFRKKVDAFRSAQFSFEQEMRMKEAKATQEITHKLVEIITETAKKSGYNFVFEKGANVLLYASKVTDITSAVVKEYNTRHKPIKTAEAKKAKAQ